MHVTNPVPRSPSEFPCGTPKSIPVLTVHRTSEGSYHFIVALLIGQQALLIGINYLGSKYELRGCINDARNVSQFLHGYYGFEYDDMVILTDDQFDPVGHPTRENILRAMQWLVNDARPHDSLFFHFSGHGGQKVDLSSDQDDVYDETISPVDFQAKGTIANYVLPLYSLSNTRKCMILLSDHYRLLAD